MPSQSVLHDSRVARGLIQSAISSVEVIDQGDLPSPITDLPQVTRFASKTVKFRFPFDWRLHLRRHASCAFFTCRTIGLRSEEIIGKLKLVARGKSPILSNIAVPATDYDSSVEEEINESRDD